jgi:hypothetical protein
MKGNLGQHPQVFAGPVLNTFRRLGKGPYLSDAPMEKGRRGLQREFSSALNRFVTRSLVVLSSR